MKHLCIILTLAVAFAFFGCKKEDPTPSTGSVTFWISQPLNYVDVTIASQNGIITIFHSPTPATCNSSGCAKFTLPNGTYSFYAEEQGLFGDTWTGSILITGGDCKLRELIS